MEYIYYAEELNHYKTYDILNNDISIKQIY